MVFSGILILSIVFCFSCSWRGCCDVTSVSARTSERQEITYARIPTECRFLNDWTLFCMDTVPKHIPADINSLIVNFTGLPQNIFIKRELFRGSNYRLLKSLELRCWVHGSDLYRLVLNSGCFSRLTGLVSLHISAFKLIVNSEAFQGLKKVRTLKMTHCRMFNESELTQSLKPYDSLPGLNELIVNDCFTWTDTGLNASVDFWTAVSSKRVTSLDVSGTFISFIDGSQFGRNCDSLEYVNLSKADVSAFRTLLHVHVCKNLRVLNMSFTHLSRKIFPCIGNSNKHNISYFLDFLVNLAAVETIISDGLCPVNPTSPIRFVNVTGVTIRTQLKWRLKNISVRYTSLQILDAEIICKDMMIEKVIFSNNILEFVNPKLLRCLRNLRYIDLSHNLLHKMSSFYPSLFEQLLWTFHKLHFVGLSGNKLSRIPKLTFFNNPSLEVIDLSDNRLNTVNFSLENCRKLLLLNLSRNMFTAIDATSRLLLGAWMSMTTSGKVDMANNEFSCSKCTNFDYMFWLSQHQHYFKFPCACSDGKNEIDIFDEKSMFKFQRRCNRETVVVLCTVVALGFVMITASTAYYVVKQQRYTATKLQIRTKYRAILAKRRVVVFVLCDIDDLQTIVKLVCEPLQNSLSMELKTSQQLVSYRKAEESAGQSIMEECNSLLRNTCIVLSVFSENSVKGICKTLFESYVLDEKPSICMMLHQQGAPVHLEDASPLKPFYKRYKHLTLDSKAEVGSLEHKILISALKTEVDKKLAMIKEDEVIPH